MALTRDQLIALCASRLDRTDLTDAMRLEILQVQANQLEGIAFKPWFLETTQQVVTTPQAETLVLPEGFIREQEDSPLQWLDPNSTALDPYKDMRKDTYTAIKQAFGDEDQAAPPQAYSLGPDVAYLRPIPDAVYTMRWRFYKRAAELASDIANAWTQWASDWMMAELCLVMAATYIRDEGLIQVYSAATQRAKDRLSVEHMARQMAARDLTMGDD